MAESTKIVKPHPANAGDSGNCEHGNPLWGVLFCLLAL